MTAGVTLHKTVVRIICPCKVMLIGFRIIYSVDVYECDNCLGSNVLEKCRDLFFCEILILVKHNKTYETQCVLCMRFPVWV